VAREELREAARSCGGGGGGEQTDSKADGSANGSASPLMACSARDIQSSTSTVGGVNAEEEDEEEEERGADLSDSWAWGASASGARSSSSGSCGAAMLSHELALEQEDIGPDIRAWWIEANRRRCVRIERNGRTAGHSEHGCSKSVYV